MKFWSYLSFATFLPKTLGLNMILKMVFTLGIEFGKWIQLDKLYMSQFENKLEHIFGTNKFLFV